MDLPELGVGLTYFSKLKPLLESHAHLVDVLEIEPQTFWYRLSDGSFKVDVASLEEVRASPGTKILHGIGFPVGGTRPPSALQLPLLQRMATELNVPWVSEHLNFNQACGPRGEFMTGFLLPPRQTAEGVTSAVASIRSMASELPVPFAVETGVNYLRPRRDELPDGAFIAAIIEAADCGLLLDLHNIWTNEKNGRQTVAEYLNQLPLERIWEIHLAGGSEYEGYWLDSHSGAIPEDLIELAKQIVPRLPNLRAMIFELFPSYLVKFGLDGVRRQLEAMRRVWDQRGKAPFSSRLLSQDTFEQVKPQPRKVIDSGITPQEWEDTLGALVVGFPVESGLGQELAADPGLYIVRDLLGDFRASMIVSTLKLTSRYLMLSLGRDAFKQILSGYWRQATPEIFASGETEGFAHYLQALNIDLPHLVDVLAFEVAVMKTLLDEQSRVVPFSCDPLPFLRALGEGRAPEIITPGDYEIEVTPDQLVDGQRPNTELFQPMH